MAADELDLADRLPEHAVQEEPVVFINPFPGLRPFSIEESHLFFGREGQSDEVLVKLAENRFVSVLGASGSGKSSLMYCGLIPTLYGGFMTDVGSDWRLVVTRPGGGPIDNLAEALLSKDQEYQQLNEEDKLIRRTITGTVLRSSSLGLIEAVKQLKTKRNENFLILVDQFEELFRYKKIASGELEGDESSAFVNLLLEAVKQREEPIFVALTMRSDFIGDCAQFPNLTQFINDSHYLIPQMTRDQKRLAIEGPVAVGSGEITGRLSQQLLNDVGDNPDQLPVLQHALMRSWQYWVENRKPGEALDITHYNAIGTLKGALSQHANEAYDLLSRREKEICEIMFKALTEKGSENQGIRRPTKLGTIARIAGVNEDEVVSVIDKFREPGRSLLMPPAGVELEPESVIDISHESLMRIWDKLRRWLDEEAKSAEMYLKLSESAERYQDGKAGLWQMPDLQLALNWQQENKPTYVWGQRYNHAFERTLVFLETSKKAYDTEQANKELLQKRRNKLSRIIAISFGVATLVLLTAMIYAFQKAGEAEDFAEKAKAETANAEKQRLKAVGLAVESERDRIAAEDAKLEADKARDRATQALDAAESAKRRADVQRRLANLSAQEAEAQRKRAIDAANRSKLAELEAKQERENADKAKRNAENLRYQAIALSMSIKSKSITDEELRGLVARQAYTYWKDYNDINNAFSADVYSGIYYALKGLTSDSLNMLKGHESAVRSLVFASSGERLYSAGSDGKILSWNMENKTSTVLFENDNVSRVVDISPDEQYLALGSDEDDIYLFRLKRPGDEPVKIEGHGGAVFDLIFLPDNTGFISSGADNTIKYSDFKTLETIKETRSRVKTLAVGPSGRYLAGGLESGEAILMDLRNMEADPLIISEDGNNPVNAITFSADGKRIAFGRYNGQIILWDVVEQKQFGPALTGFTGPVTDLEFSRNDKYLGATSTDKTARIWSLSDIYELPIVLDDHEDWVFTLDFHPNGEYLVTGSKKNIIRTWPVKPDAMAEELCTLLSRDMSDTEWVQYVGEDIPKEETCK